MVTELFYEVYADCKKVTPTINSFPCRRLARKVAKHVSENFDQPFTSFRPTERDVRYNSPDVIKRIRSMIADHVNAQLYKDLTQAWASWHSQGGKVDLRQRSNEFHMISFAHRHTGELREELTKIVEKPSRGAAGQIEAFENCIVQIMPNNRKIKPEDVWELFRKDREDHLEIRTLDVDDEIYIPGEMPAKGFDDILLKLASGTKLFYIYQLSKYNDKETINT